jgi:hypothetical protein
VHILCVSTVCELSVGVTLHELGGCISQLLPQKHCIAKHFKPGSLKTALALLGLRAVALGSLTKSLKGVGSGP